MNQEECADFVEKFAGEYVEKWERTLKSSASSNTIKAHGWAILQAARALRTFVQKPKFRCSACEDSGWLWSVNSKVPCDVCEMGLRWLQLQTSPVSASGKP